MNDMPDRIAGETEWRPQTRWRVRLWELLPLRRTLVVGCIALSSAALTWAIRGAYPASPSDLAQVWIAARAYLAGVDPYSVVGPDRPFQWGFPLLYPFPAVLVFLPFAPLPMRWVDPLWVGFGSGLLAWVLTRQRVANPQLLVFASFAYCYALILSQWSPLLTAAALLPWGGVILACKPTVGLALFAAYPGWRAMIGAAAAILASLLLYPRWPIAWLGGLSQQQHVTSLILHPGGPLILLALLRWRRSEARLLMALACVPLTPSIYEAIPLFLIPETWFEAGLLAALTYLVGITLPPFSVATFNAYLAASADRLVWFLYLPCVVMLLRRPGTVEQLARTSPSDPSDTNSRAADTTSPQPLLAEPRDI